ncbi:hypothetical protein E1176_02510, partial [Fulvivirga sp. RKSG066]|uniref:hypothetical protein n=1 Tax=Fulvivirga aurantia TaxID=2529383 RepID=UPI0012BC835A
MIKIRLLLILIYCFLCNAIYAQNNLEEIKKEYYKLNGNIVLQHVKIDSYNYFIENGKIRIARYKNDYGSIESYYSFNLKDGVYKAFFIYFNPDDGVDLPDARIYLNSDGNVFLYKENNLEKSYFSRHSALSKLQLQSQNALNHFNNTFLKTQDRLAIIKIQIDSLQQSIETASLIKVDTASDFYDENQSQYFIDGDVIYMNTSNELVKTVSSSGDNHGSRKTWKYFTNGILALKITESEYYINGFQYQVIKEYYHKPRRENLLFRKDLYRV